MAIAFSNLGASASPDFVAGAGTSYLSPSWTPPASGLILLVVVNSETDAFNDPATVTGNGLTWVQIGTTTWEFDGVQDISRISLYAANASGSSAGQTTLTFLDPQNRCEASFFHAAGADLSGGVLNAFRQYSSQVGNSNSGTVGLLSPLSANNRPIAAYAHRVNEAMTPRTNWTEMDDLLDGVRAAQLETQVRQDAFETTTSASWSSFAEWGGIAVELKAAAGGTPAPVFMNHLKQQGIS